MTKHISIPIAAFRPLAKGKRGLPVRVALIGNVQKLLTEWIGANRRIGDQLVVEVTQHEQKI